MSARDELFESLTPSHCRPAPGEAESVNALIDAYRDEVRAEVRREAAAELREFVGPEVMEHESERIARYVLGWHHAADHIDPDKGES
ncbi:hypothetical protein OG436_29495 [Streptomyces caniferus]|uniref:hypothetical protein n=1 Tax=Streptomyces caniferus TaxID=285557 RepID=UPI002E2D2F0F|nr:hypothetical protein [Streptomyces caniferus]